MKKCLKITSLVVASIIMLLVIMGIIDYRRAMKGKRPLFITSYAWFIGNENETHSYQYSGFGYTILSCNNEDFSFHLGNRVAISCFDVEQLMAYL